MAGTSPAMTKVRWPRVAVAPRLRPMTSIREFEYAGWKSAAASYDGFAAITALFVPPLLAAADVKPGTSPAMTKVRWPRVAVAPRLRPMTSIREFEYAGWKSAAASYDGFELADA